MFNIKNKIVYLIVCDCFMVFTGVHYIIYYLDPIDRKEKIGICRSPGDLEFYLTVYFHKCLTFEIRITAVSIVFFFF